MTIAQAAIQIPANWLELYAMAALSLSLFRLPLRMNAWRIALITLAMALVSIYIRDVHGLFNYSVPFVIASYLVLTFLLLRLPFMYTLIVCMTGYLAGVLVQASIGVAAMQLNWTSPELLQHSIAHKVGISLSTAALIFLLVYGLRRKKIGFMFIAERFRGAEARKREPLILAVTMVLAIVLIELGVISLTMEDWLLSLFMAILGIFLFAVSYAYQYNKKLIKRKYRKMDR